MKILVIDDNKSITKSLEKYLKIVGFEVKTCNEGLEGLELIKKNEWDTILLDLSMPEFSGLDIIDDLEKNKVLKNKNIILFTASSVSEYVLDKLIKKEGIKTCLKKPISLSKITEVMAS
jgi:DNA-binding response OmpR family regulator